MKSSDGLNTRQQAIFDFIQEKIQTKGYPPSVREIGAAVGLKSSSTVHAYLVQLEDKGYITKDPSKPRTLIPVTKIKEMESNVSSISLPVVGNVAAGTPILAQENIETYLPVPVDFVARGNHYILKVKGESMVEAGILDGDFLIVHEQNNANNGEIVVAMLDDEATVKRFYKRDDYVELKPENCTMQPILTRDVVVLGKVTGLFRHM